MKKLKFLFFPTILALAFGLMLSCSKSSEDTINETVADTNDAINDGVANTNDNLEDILEDNNDTATDLEDAITGGEDSSDSSATEDISFDPSSVPDNATTVAFGQSYQYQVGTSGTYSGSKTYSLSNEPDNMTISPSGLVEWTPTKASDIKTHSNITITLTTASGYVLTQTYDLTVTGTCTTGNVLAIWSGDQRSSTDSSKFLGNITAYTDNSSSVKTASQNYNYYSAAVHLTHGPSPSATKGNVFFYNQYDNTTHIYFFYMFGVAGNSSANKVHLDLYTVSNTSSDSVIVTDDTVSGGPDETVRESQTVSDSLYASTYAGRYAYNSSKSDGAVIGPFSGTSYRILVDLAGKSSLTSSHSTSPAENLAASGVSGYDLGVGGLESFTFWSKDGTSFALGAVDNFTVGYNTTLDCSN
jgi:hypothetical protein